MLTVDVQLYTNFFDMPTSAHSFVVSFPVHSKNQFPTTSTWQLPVHTKRCEAFISSTASTTHKMHTGSSAPCSITMKCITLYARFSTQHTMQYPLQSQSTSCSVHSFIQLHMSVTRTTLSHSYQRNPTNTHPVSASFIYIRLVSKTPADARKAGPSCSTQAGPSCSTQAGPSCC